MNVFIADIGNDGIKGKTKSSEVYFRHAIKALTDTDYERVLIRAGENGPPPDYLRINGQAYVVGASAERHGTLSRRTAAARYTADYYGVLVAAGIARAYNRSGEIQVFGSHPPGDLMYRDDLMSAVVGEWEVEIEGHRRLFNVSYANTFEEPVGGLMNVILSEDGRHYKRTDISDGRALVIDIGGHTTDWLAVNPGGAVDYSLAESTALGVHGVLRDFERSFRENQRDAFKSATTNLPPERVREAIQTGEFRGGGRIFPCQHEVQEAISLMLNAIADTYQTVAQGPTNWDSIILTGGGSGMLYDHLLPILDHNHVLLADEPEGIHLANVRGGLKLWRLYQQLGVL